MTMLPALRLAADQNSSAYKAGEWVGRLIFVGIVVGGIVWLIVYLSRRGKGAEAQRQQYAAWQQHQAYQQWQQQHAYQSPQPQPGPPPGQSQAPPPTAVPPPDAPGPPPTN
jgi:hypothetical protein